MTTRIDYAFRADASATVTASCWCGRTRSVDVPASEIDAAVAAAERALWELVAVGLSGWFAPLGVVFHPVTRITVAIGLAQNRMPPCVCDGAQIPLDPDACARLRERMR